MQAGGIHHAVEELAVFICELVVDIEEANLFTVCELRNVLVDLVDRRHNCDVANRNYRLARLVGCNVLLGGRASVTFDFMIVKAHVREGRLVVDEPTGLPEGTEIDLLPLDPGDWLDEADRAALHEALRQSDADVAAGRLVDAEEILKDLRSR